MVLKKFPVYEALVAYPYNQSNQNFRYGVMKVFAQDFDDQKERAI